MTDFELRSQESDEEKLERLAHDFEERDRAQEAVVANVAATSRTSARALFALGIIAGAAGSSILWIEHRVEAFLESIQPNNYSVTLSASDVATTEADRILVVIDEVAKAYKVALAAPVVPGSDGGKKEAMQKLLTCTLSARDAIVTPEGAQTLVAPFSGCEEFLLDISEYEPAAMAKDIAAASMTALVSLDRGVLSDVLVATWDSERFMPTHRDLTSVMALATFVDRDFENGEFSCGNDAQCRFDNSLSLARNLVVSGNPAYSMNDLAQPLGDGAFPYRYVALISNLADAGAYNVPMELYVISTSEGDTIVEAPPVVRFEYEGDVATPIVLSNNDLWNGSIQETELVVGGMKPVGWWPCNVIHGYSFYPKQGVWIERYQAVPTVCENANYETLEGVTQDMDYDKMTTTVARPEAVAKAIALFE